MSEPVDVAIVGAGVAGLVAARESVRRGNDVVVLEARDRVGGRLLNEELCDGVLIEMGGQWVGPGQDRVLALIGELGLSTFPTHTAGRHILEVGNSRTLYTGRVPLFNPLAMADVGRAQWALRRAARRIPLDEPWTATGGDRLDGQTFATWLDRRLHTDDGHAIMHMATEAIFAAGPEDISALWALFYIHAAGGLDALINVSGGAQQDRVVGGSQRIALALAEELADRVVLGTPVTAIDWTSSGVVLHTAGGSSYEARRAIVAVPPPLAARIRFNPALPTDRDQLLQRMPMGRVIKVNVGYSEPFWRADGLSGQANSGSRALGTVFDNTPSTGNPGVLVGFLEGRHADFASRLSPDERRRKILADLVGYFGESAAGPIAYLERDWAAEEYTRGCYGAFAGPMALTRFGPALRTPIGPLHWAGTETATAWAGYIDGAIQSGQRSADEVAQTLSRTTTIEKTAESPG
ncbi:MAG: FAD-dependent oxidoreductase [Nocardia sp.]|uniref:flavin monoamine oxidase family protein n=1 Tax=Nocardia sp. TaxID=1821 RepID=UPI0026174E9E|nr:flavin monoamine oxidase family protein [Nocardia sp.]MCU1641457.1 FAD-dependent oxidoreductase [Nocardia sp.]